MVGTGIVVVLYVTPAHAQALEYCAEAVQTGAVDVKRRFRVGPVTVAVPVVEVTVRVLSMMVVVAIVETSYVVEVVTIWVSVKLNVSTKVSVETTGESVLFRGYAVV